MLAWGKKVTKPFRDKVQDVATSIEVEPNFLMACMAFETGRSFSPAVKNGAGSGAVGLIQFMPSTAQALGTTTAALAAMSAVRQLDFVEKYFAPRKGKLKTLEDVYMAILWPAAIGKPNSHVLFSKADATNPKRYVQNAGLDYNSDGIITKEEASDRVRKQLTAGLKPQNASE
jgi:hypothetical protein